MVQDSRGTYATRSRPHRRRVLPLLLASLFAVALLLNSSPSATASHVNPPSGADYGMVYEAGRDRMVLFGGERALGFIDETWAYDHNANTWTPLNPSGSPSTERYGLSMAHDGESDRTILFGGQAEVRSLFGATYQDETWAYDAGSNTWAEVTPDPRGPSGRSFQQMIYDAQSDRVVLFGGWREGAFSDTWAYDHNANTWTEQAPSAAPLARFAHAMAYDAESDRVILFGGVQDEPLDSVHLADTWAYDHNANTWTQRAAGPPGRWGAAMAYDAESDRVILFGGRRDMGIHSVFLNDTWAYDHNTDTWNQMALPGGPAGTAHSAMAYDAESDRVILFGGVPSVIQDRPMMDTGILGETTDATWAYDYNTDTWTLMTHPGPPRNLRASPGDGVVNLSWVFPAQHYGAPIGYRIYRGTTPGSLSLLATVGSVPSYSDRNVTNRETYFYQVTAVNQEGEGPPAPEVSAMPAEPMEPPDTIPPTITIDPRDPRDIRVGEELTITGTVSDNVGVALVEISRDMVTWQPVTGTTNWSATVTIALGDNEVFIRATDTSGNTATAGFNIHLDGPVGRGLILAIGIGGAAALGVGLFLFFRGRRKPGG